MPAPSASPPPSVAGPGPRVGERSPHLLRNRDELPAVGVWRQCQLEDTVVRAARLAVRNRGPEPVGAAAACPDHELADPPRRVGSAIRGLECEALVVVLVSRQDHVRPGLVQRLPQRLRLRLAAVGRARAETGVMPIGERADLRVRGEVGTEPALLGGARAHVQIRVQRDDVPGAEIVAVVAYAPFPGRDTEVTEVAGRRRRVVIVVAGNGVRALLETSPGRLIDRKSTRLNSSHLVISYAVFCLKKKKSKPTPSTCFTSRHNITASAPPFLRTSYCTRVRTVV